MIIFEEYRLFGGLLLFLRSEITYHNYAEDIRIFWNHLFPLSQ